MTVFAIHPETLKDVVASVLGDKVKQMSIALGELTLVVRAVDYLDAARLLRDAPGCCFEQLLDLCGVDYSSYGDGAYEGARFCGSSGRRLTCSASCLKVMRICAAS